MAKLLRRRGEKEEGKKGRTGNTLKNTWVKNLDKNVE